MDYKINKQPHTKTGEDMWVLAFEENITPKSEWYAMKKKMKSLTPSAYWSGYAGGFVFKVEPSKEMLEAQGWTELERTESGAKPRERKERTKSVADDWYKNVPQGTVRRNSRNAKLMWANVVWIRPLGYNMYGEKRPIVSDPEEVKSKVEDIKKSYDDDKSILIRKTDEPDQFLVYDYPNYYFHVTKESLEQLNAKRAEREAAEAAEKERETAKWDSMVHSIYDSLPSTATPADIRNAVAEEIKNSSQEFYEDEISELEADVAKKLNRLRDMPNEQPKQQTMADKLRSYILNQKSFLNELIQSRLGDNYKFEMEGNRYAVVLDEKNIVLSVIIGRLDTENELALDENLDQTKKNIVDIVRNTVMSAFYRFLGDDEKASEWNLKPEANVTDPELLLSYNAEKMLENLREGKGHYSGGKWQTNLTGGLFKDKDLAIQELEKAGLVQKIDRNPENGYITYQLSELVGLPAPEKEYVEVSEKSRLKALELASMVNVDGRAVAYNFGIRFMKYGEYDLQRNDQDPHTVIVYDLVKQKKVGGIDLPAAVETKGKDLIYFREDIDESRLEEMAKWIFTALENKRKSEQRTLNKRGKTTKDDLVVTDAGGAIMVSNRSFETNGDYDKVAAINRNTGAIQWRNDVYDQITEVVDFVEQKAREIANRNNEQSDNAASFLEKSKYRIGFKKYIAENGRFIYETIQEEYGDYGISVEGDTMIIYKDPEYGDTKVIGEVKIGLGGENPVRVIVPAPLQENVLKEIYGIVEGMYKLGKEPLGDKVKAAMKPAPAPAPAAAPAAAPAVAPETSKKISFDASSYKNQHQLNQSIEAFITKTMSSDIHSFTDDEKEFIYKYEGAGGLIDEGAEGAGIMTEFYTPELLIRKMWALAYKFGFAGGKILENSVGVGRFLDYVNFARDKVTAYEKSEFSARICKIIHPSADVRRVDTFAEHFYHTGMRRSLLNPDYEKDYDLVIGNPPYGGYSDPKKTSEEKHNRIKFQQLEFYFILRGLDCLRAGGLLVYVVPSNLFVAESKYAKIQQAILNKAELLDAYLLPNETFANTEVATCVIVLKKK